MRHRLDDWPDLQSMDRLGCKAREVRYIQWLRTAIFLYSHTMYEHYHRWYSPSLSRDIEVLAFGTRGYPVMLFPTSMGRFSENKDFKLIETLIEKEVFKVLRGDRIPAELVHGRLVAGRSEEDVVGARPSSAVVGRT